MSLLEITSLSHTFGEKILYKDASFSLFKGEHMGVVGQNGAGKSTLIKIFTGEVVPDEGQIKWQTGVHIGALNQYAEVDGSNTICSYLKTAFSDLYQIEKKMLYLYDKAALGEEEVLYQAAKLQEKLDAQRFYQLDNEIARVVTGLGIDALGMDSILQELSGGQRAKVILAKLLLENADVLLLDEPTNFLDKEHVKWLSSYLAEFPGAFVVVSHDFDFLESTTNCICDVEFETIKKYHGTYSHFVRQKEERRQQYVRDYHAQQKKIRETEAFIRKNKAGVNARIARGRQKQLDRMERLTAPSFAKKPVIEFLEKPLAGGVALKTTQLEVGYTKRLLPKLNLSMKSGEKVVITGFNGIGKSTLLKTIVKEIPAISGTFEFSDSVKIGYYEQDLSWKNPYDTPIQVIRQWYAGLTEKEIRKKLAQCGVKAEHITQTVSSLSGGEQSKVKLCRLMLSPANFLILDEPTNHLDAETKEALKHALEIFSGSILLVSHEEAFYHDWVERVIPITGRE